MITLEPPRGMAVDEAMSTDAEVWRALGLSRAGLGRFLRTAQEAVGLRGEVQVLLAGDGTLRRLNREFRGKNKATDVLSFPAPVEVSGELAGDLAISLETAERQAREHAHSLRDEVRVLLLHGLLHLAGMDHEVDGGEMAGREAELRTRLGLKRGLIARVEGKHTLGAKARSSSEAVRPEAEASGDPVGKATTRTRAETSAKANAGSSLRSEWKEKKEGGRRRVVVA